MLDSLKHHFSLLKNEGSLQKIREKAWDYLNEIGLPQKKQEAFQYVPLRELYNQHFELPKKTKLPTKKEIEKQILPESLNSHLVFVDGIFVPELSSPPKELMIQPFQDAFQTYSSFLHHRLGACIHEETDPFAILNLSFANQALFGYLPPKTELKTPLQCLYILTQKETMVSPRFHLFLGKESKMRLVSTFCPDQPGMINSVLDLVLAEGAQAHQTSFLAKESSTWIFDAVRATLKNDSQLKTLSISRGAKSHRQSYAVALAGSNAEAALEGAWLLRAGFSTHLHVTIDHQAPHTRSKQLFKGVIGKTSVSSFEGKIHVRQAAQKTEAYQLNNNLLLEEHALAYSKPNLQIFADDVKASHGSTVGEMDLSSLFYLKTRGIPEAEAKKLLVGAFCQEVGTKVELPSLRHQFANELENFLKVQP
jgi:Fe-S cluster assembly protein SufD